MEVEDEMVRDVSSGTTPGGSSLSPRGGEALNTSATINDSSLDNLYGRLIEAQLEEKLSGGGGSRLQDEAVTVKVS